MPQEDRLLTTRAELTDNLAMTLGGRGAEEIVFSEITTGASNDLEKVTATAKQMVMRFGMSEKKEYEGLLAGATEEEVFGSEAPPPGPPLPGEPALLAALQRG
jgi:ATP-dependent Zn protease